MTFRSISLRATALFVLALAHPAMADERGTVTMVPADCVPYWRGADTATPEWNSVLSLAGCLQDASIEAIGDRDDLPAFIDRLASRLIPSLALYATAVQDGPDPVKLRAVYQIGLAEVSFIVRARRSIASPALRPRLEELLEPSAAIAILAFAAVVHVAAEDPSMASDPVTRFMVRDAYQRLEQMVEAWPEVTTDTIRLATPTLRR